MSNGDTVKTVTISEPVRDWDWSYVAVSYDADIGKARLLLLEKPYAPGDQFSARQLSAEGAVGDVIQVGPLRIAAVRDGKGAARAKYEKPGRVFNGRIQDVRLADKVLSGAVFSTGSIAWISSTLDNQYDNDVATITRNVIERFLDRKPFPPIGASVVPDVDRLPLNPEYEHSDQR